MGKGVGAKEGEGVGEGVIESRIKTAMLVVVVPVAQYSFLVKKLSCFWEMGVNIEYQRFGNWACY